MLFVYIPHFDNKRSSRNVNFLTCRNLVTFFKSKLLLNKYLLNHKKMYLLFSKFHRHPLESEHSSTPDIPSPATDNDGKDDCEDPA